VDSTWRNQTTFPHPDDAPLDRHLAAVVFEVTEALVPVTHPQPVSASWTARALCLVADRSSPGVARNEILAMFPLGLQAPSR